jgi:hypothetical protein
VDSKKIQVAIGCCLLADFKFPPNRCASRALSRSPPHSSSFLPLLLRAHQGISLALSPNIKISLSFFFHLFHLISTWQENGHTAMTLSPPLSCACWLPHPMHVKLPYTCPNPVSTAKLLCPTTLTNADTSPLHQPAHDRWCRLSCTSIDNATLITWLPPPHPSATFKVGFFSLFLI